MTTAHRPTWAPAKGGEEQGGTRIFAPSRQFSAKDQASHTKLKFRQPGQSAAVDLAERDLKAELEEKERKHFRETHPDSFEEEQKNDLKLLEVGPDPGGGPPAKAKVLVPKALDADDEDDADLSDDSDDDDEDEEAELLAELARIKAERAKEAAREAEAAAARSAATLQEELVRGNPLINQTPTFQVKRRWDDDVVFRNQTRGEPKATKRFINDTIRSDFHRRFLSRYIK